MRQVLGLSVEALSARARHLEATLGRRCLVGIGYYATPGRRRRNHCATGWGASGWKAVLRHGLWM